MFKVNIKDIDSGVLIVNFEHITQLFLVLLLLNLDMYLFAGLVHCSQT